MTTPPVQTTRMTFDEEFNTFSKSPDGSTGTWTTTYPFGGETARTLPGNNEAEFYSDTSVGMSPFSLSSGVLTISATPAAPNSNPYNLTYDSGVITTHDSFAQEYGYFEVSAELPAGQGLWPAFWMIPSNDSYSAELDVFEQLGNDPKTIISTVHDWAGHDAATSQNAFAVPDASAGFHTYGVDWEPTTTTFYEDGKALATVATPASMQTPMQMMLNLAVGGTGSWPGAPDSSTQFPANMKIDYVHAYATANTTSVSGRAALTGQPATPPVVTAAVTPPVVAPAVTPPVVVPPVTSPAATTLGSGADTLAVSVSEDAYQGDAQFTISVDGKQIGGIQTATASHTAGATQLFSVKGAFAPGQHSASLNFLNDAYAGTASTDRNLYVTAASMDGAAVTGASLSLMSNGTQSFAFQGAAAPTAAIPPVVVPPVAPSATTTIGTGTDTFLLNLSEDAYVGDAQFNISIDGKQIGGTQTATASHASGATQTFDVRGTFTPGQHSMSINFLNDLYGGSASTDRNLYVTSGSVDGTAVLGASLSLLSDGEQSISFQGPAAVTPAPSGGLVLHLTEDAYQGNALFTVAVDGHQLGTAQAVTALNSAGGSQAFNFADLLATGTHDLAVSFTNDLYGGTSSTDRNLYIKGAEYGGKAIASVNTDLYSNGTQHYAFAV